MFNTADGIEDTLLDVDGLGQIVLDGEVLTGGDVLAPGRWERDGVIYSFSPVASDLGDLWITTDSGVLVVQGFRNVRLGIGLTATPARPTPSVTRTFLGDLSPVDFDPGTPGVQAHYDEFGNVITDPELPEPGRSDFLYGSADRDAVFSYGGRDGLGAANQSEWRLAA